MLCHIKCLPVRPCGGWPEVAQVIKIRADGTIEPLLADKVKVDILARPLPHVESQCVPLVIIDVCMYTVTW